MKKNIVELETICKVLSENINKILKIQNKFRSYYTDILDEEYILYWLLQFENINDVNIALKLLDNIHYIDELKLVSLIKQAIIKTKIDISKNSIICPAGKNQDSSARICYGLLKSFDIDESQIVKTVIDISELPNYINENQKPSNIIFIDDNLTSGIQFKQFFYELITDKVEKREMILKSLDVNTITFLKSIPIYYCVGIELGEGAIEIEKYLSQEGFNIKIFSGIKNLDSSLIYGNSIWDSERELGHACNLIAKISRQLFEDKKWDEDKLNKRLLGFGNLGKLVVFSHNIPKALIPFFWKAGYYNHKFWVPLFPERAEWKKYSEQITNLDSSKLIIIRQIISGYYTAKKSVCHAEFCLAEGSSPNIRLFYPTQEYLNKQIEKITNDLIELSKRGYTGQHLNSIMGLTGLYSMYANYDREVEIYNSEIKKYKIEISEYIKYYAGLRTITFRIYNEGSLPANGVILNVELNDFVDYISDPSEIPEKPQQPQEGLGMSLYKIRNFKVSPIFPKFDNSIKCNVINGKKVLTIKFPKILHHTYEDKSISYLLFLNSCNECQLKYDIITEDNELPFEGVFNIALDYSRDILPTFITEYINKNIK